MKQSDVDFDHLRTGLAESIAVQAPPLEPLKRIRPASLLLVVGTAVAANSLISQVADIGLSTVSEQLKSATLSILAVTFALKVVGYALPVVGLRAATRQPLPGAPVAIFQSAKSFVGLVGSGPLGTVALAVRFFQRLGVSAATALTAQSITRAVGFVAEVMLLLLTSRTVRTSFDSNDGGGSGNRRLVILVVAAIVVGTVVLLVAPKIRASILRSVREAMVDLRAVATSPVRLGQIAAGELAQRLLSAMALATTAAAFGVSVPFGALVFASVATGLVAGISAVPAGVGVAEGAMTSLLSAVGVAPEQAFAIAITHRVVTSYLPPLLGFFSVRWLQRAGYL